MNTHEILQLIINLIEVLAWPMVVIIILLMFKEQLRTLLLRIEEAWWGDRGAKFRKEEQEAAEALSAVEAELQAVPEQGAIDWTKSGDLFWIGNDLMWIKDMLYRGAPKNYSIAGMKKALAYLERLGFADTYAHGKLKRLVEIAEARSPAGWTPPWRSQIAKEIEPIKQFVASRAESNQPGFTKPPGPFDE